ncbi:MAG: HD domain-containing protein [Planctomycetes bacterium]|nr:HD domain-containing protein [Planctomycetota bacterium]
MTHPSEGTSVRERVLVVDDSAEVRNTLRRALARDYLVDVAATAELALERLEAAAEDEFALVLADHEMPGMSGIELLSRVRDTYPDVVRVLLTGLPAYELAVRALHQGQVFGLLSKPCDAGALREVVADACAVRRRAVEAHLLTGRLAFSSQSLAQLNLLLEERVDAQTHSLHCMHRFAAALNSVEDLRGVAEATAQALFETLATRGVHVQVWDPEEVGVECSLGPEMSTDLLSEPITTADGQVGEIIVDARSFPDGALTPAQLDMIAAIASTAAVAVHNEFRRRERDEAQYSTIVALARLSEQRDNETGKHLERVSQYCEMIARRLREEATFSGVIDDEFVRDLRRSAPLHDIGKVGIPDSILLKPGKLNNQEWEIMRTHPEIGANTLESVILENRNQGFLLMGRDIAWCHHEKWDGSGYPRGLRAEEIPLSARILALADVYDALTTVRPYKDAWTHQEALAWIRERAGEAFDPRVVDAFVHVSDAANEVRARLADRRDDVLRKVAPEGVRRSA